MRVAILAAGYGTRLYPLTLQIAKPLVKINNKPIINFLIEKIEILKKKTRIEEIRIVVNSKFYKDFLSWKKEYGIKAKILNDGSTSPQDMLGAVRDIKFAIGNSKSDWLIIGGDNLFEDDLIEFVKLAKDKKSHSIIGLYDVKDKKTASRFGIVALNENMQVVRLQEKPDNPSSTLAATCIYFFPKESLNFLETMLKENNQVDAAGRYIAWLSEKTKVFGYTLQGKWIDIGHFDSLEEAKKYFK
ncbi:MAG: nucleotidyltransferase family protein [Candidatus Omnitrophica bacterium]|jgi:glucose-1-phosphate thymidylyltransferase|nr:nucleotidyltransferase family protein [Candidatus Omnitrophota bacterium]